MSGEDEKGRRDRRENERRNEKRRNIKRVGTQTDTENHKERGTISGQKSSRE